jgi:FtsP/CotA-like multicopper oxidase with cupredoxin domain
MKGQVGAAGRPPQRGREPPPIDEPPRETCDAVPGRLISDPAQKSATAGYGEETLASREYKKTLMSHEHRLARWRAAFVSAVTVAALAGCGPSSSQSPMDGSAPDGSSTDGAPDAAPGRQPAGWDQGLRLPEPVDRNPAPDVVEIDLEAKVSPVSIVAGGSSPVWSYNGLLPGPLIRVPTGARLIVHFKNSLPEETTVHWHGVRLPADQDGVPAHSQPAIAPGGTFDYSFVVPDSGLYWYHPHFRSARQVGDGLYGALLVEPRGTAAPAGEQEPDGLGDNLVLVLSDIAVNANGTLFDPDYGGDPEVELGREGNVLLVNGKVAPTVLARRGMRQRWRIVNSAKSRYFQIALPGHKLVRIGGDGGLITAPVETDQLLLTPGERADVLITPQGDPGARIPLRWLPFDRGNSSGQAAERDLMFVEITGDAPYPDGAIPAALRAIAPLAIAPGDRRRDISLTRRVEDGMLVMGIDGVASWDATPLDAKVATTEVWNVSNATQWDHPFHLHGFLFQPVNPDTGRPIDPPEWKDTLNVPKDFGLVSFVVRYDDRPGMWMFHCHILDHADVGMMGMVHLSR